MKQPIDFVIITALKEEREAVLAKLPGHKRLDPNSDDIRIYYSADVETTFPSGIRGTYHVVVMPLLGMGRVDATAATADAIHHWNPRYIILVGIAGGIATKGVHLGDILLADQIVDYELQKLKPKETEVRWKVYNVEPRFLGVVSNFGNDWHDLLNTIRPDDGIPECHIGSILSGDKVIADAKVLTKYHDIWSRLVGVEMEAGGVACTSFQAPDAPGFFMIRGVSDLADKEKDSNEVKKWRQYACDVAASYTIALIKSGPVVSSAKQATLEIDDKPLPKKNPFIHGRPVQSDEFIDREYELSTVFNRLRNSDSTAIIGAPHIGKTSLLMRIMDKDAQLYYLGDDAPNFSFSNFNFHSIDEIFTPTAFWEKVLTPLQKLSCQDDITLRLDQLGRTGYTNEYLDEFFNFLDDRKKQLILVLDEFDLLLHHPNFQKFSFYATLRSIAAYRSCSVILASRTSFADLQKYVDKLPFSGGSPVLNFLMELGLKPFDEKSIETLITRAGDAFFLEYKNIIQFAAGRHPYLVQMTAANLIAMSADTRRQATIEHFCNSTLSHFDDLWCTLSDRERTTVIILGLVECGKCKPENVDDSEIQDLAGLGAGLRALSYLGLAEHVTSGDQSIRKCLVWQEEYWTLGAQVFVCWVYKVVIGRTHSLPVYDDWLKNEGFCSLLSPEQWHRLITRANLARSRMCDGLPIKNLFE